MIFLRRIDHKLKVIEVKDLIEEGITCPVRCILSEGVEAIVKYPKNPMGTYILINEWVGNSIADLIGLTIPQYGQCYLSKEVIEETNFNDEIDIDNSGNCFFSYKLKNAVPPNRYILSKATNHETERLLLFDHLIGNEDRHNGNILYEVGSEKTIFFIDCSHIMIPQSRNLNDPLEIDDEHLAEVILNDSLLTNKRDNVYDMLCETMGYDEDKLYLELANFQKVITIEVLEEIKNSIPKEWVNGATKDRIERMFIVLKKKLLSVSDIADMIAKERMSRQWKKY